jgi:hypothetical protein
MRKIKGYIKADELKHVRKLTGDKKYSRSRLKSMKWHLPTELTIKIHEYFKRKGK